MTNKLKILDGELFDGWWWLYGKSLGGKENACEKCSKFIQTLTSYCQHNKDAQTNRQTMAYCRVQKECIYKCCFLAYPWEKLTRRPLI